MEDLKQDKILAFDSYFSEPHIQMLKLLFPYTPLYYQKYLAMYIKFMELKLVMKHDGWNPTQPNPDLLMKELYPFCNRKEKATLENIMNLLHTMDSYKDILDMINTMKDIFPEGMNLENMDMDTLSQMMGMFSK